MPKDVTPPPPAPYYEGYRWLGSQWGRSGNAKPSKIGGTLMLAAAVVVYAVAVNAVKNDSVAGAIIASVVVGTVCVLAAAFYFVEAHFAGRAQREQVPTVPGSQAEPPPPPEPSVGP